jgi:hypothetical protein
MPAPADFEGAYDQLREIMTGAAAGMKVVTDAPGNLVVHAPWTQPAKPKDAVWFGAVQVKKGYVSYHLMPLYGRPELKQAISPELAKRMQGKSCFNFKRPEPELFEELRALTRQGAELYAKPFELEPHG